MKNALKKCAAIVAAVAAAVGCALLLTIAASETGFRETLPDLPIPDANEQGGAAESRQIDWGSYPDAIVAWIEVPGTSVNEPVAQADAADPNRYLYVDATGRGGYSTSYFDCECTTDSDFMAIYGHHMSDGSVFADLAKYSDADYAVGHSQILLYTRGDDALREFEVIAADVVNANSETIQVSFASANERISYLSAAIENADFSVGSIDEDDTVLALATCSYQTSNSRTVVYAKEVK